MELEGFRSNSLQIYWISRVKQAGREEQPAGATPRQACALAQRELMAIMEGFPIITGLSMEQRMAGVRDQKSENEAGHARWI